MSVGLSEALEERVLVLAPTARDAATSREVLEAAGVACFLCHSIEDVCREATCGAGAAVVTAEALLDDQIGRLSEWLKTQPAWSDFPLVVLTPRGAESLKYLTALELVGHMTFVKRPVEVSVLVSTLRSALRDRCRQYAVRQLLAERLRAEEALRVADRNKDDFIALLAHELRNPLAPIRNGLHIIRLSDRREDRDQARTMMDRQLTHMVRLIDDLLDISRISRNKIELRLERVTLAEALAIAVETARPVIEGSGHNLIVALPEDRITLTADLTRLAQIFSNLLVNSAKYTPAGGKIWLSAERNGNTVSVSVRDNGIGIPEESLPTVFNMFSQVNRSIERTTGGLGIGLALVKSLTDMHGGTVTAASDANGTTMTVVLPVAERAEPRKTLPNGIGCKE